MTVTHHILKRLKGFDYTKPYFYEVTLKRGARAVLRDHERDRAAEGRMLFLSLYPALDRLPTKSEFYQRCHEMGDIAVAGLREKV